MTPSLVIFDCDGVLVDTEPLANKVLCRMINELGKPIELDEVIRRWVGRSMSAVQQELEADLGRPLDNDWIGEVRAETIQAFQENGISAIPGIKQAIAAIDRAGIPICVASSGSIEKMSVTLGATGLWDRLGQVLFSAYNVANGKPAPDLFLHAAQSMGHSPQDCVVIEDSPFGVRAAISAGMRALGYAGASGADAAQLRMLGAETFTDMAELPNLLQLEERA